MRSVWKGSISFGLVNIPIAVYPATREEKLSFKQLRVGDLSPIRYKKVAEVDNKEVPPDNIIKGYEFEKGQWITLTDDDFDSVEIESSHTIEIAEFVDIKTINPKFFHTPYFLEAQKGGEKGYALLHRALFESEKAGIAKVAIRSREYLAAVKTDGLFLMLDLMHFADEVLEPEGLRDTTDKTVTPKELSMAKQLIESMSADWDPQKYKDEYRTALMKIIDAKVAKKPLTKKAARVLPSSDIVDLAAILQESLNANSKTSRNRVAKPEPDAAKRRLRRRVA